MFLDRKHNKTLLQTVNQSLILFLNTKNMSLHPSYNCIL